MWGRLYAADAVALERRLTEMAKAVCGADPRTMGQRRADALAALAAGRELTCQCGSPDCPAEPASQPGGVVIHVLAEPAALTAHAQTCGVTSDDVVALTGDKVGSSVRLEKDDGLVTMQPAQSPALTAGPGFVLGGGITPAPLIAELARYATVIPLPLPGVAPEPRYRPSEKLEWLVKCRDLTCRFPGCDQPADLCDLDHTVAYPVGPTHPSNLKCLCCRASSDRHAGEHVERGEQGGGGGGVSGYHHLSGPSRRHFCRSASAARTAASLTR